MKRVINEFKISKVDNKYKLNKVVNEFKLTSQNVIVKTNTIVESGVIEYDFDESTENEVFIGEVPAGSVVIKSVVIVENQGVGLANIGTNDAQGILINPNQNDLTEIGIYEVNNHLKFTETTSFKLFLDNNTAIGKALIYYK